MKATETVGYKHTSNYLYRVPIREYYAGRESYALINPKLVSSMTPTEVSVDDENSTDFHGQAPARKTIKGTRVTTSEEAYFVPLSPTETADALDIELVGMKQ